MMYKRTLKHEDSVETIIYQDNGWKCHIVRYNDGTVEQFYEKAERHLFRGGNAAKPVTSPGGKEKDMKYPDKMIEEMAKDIGTAPTGILKDDFTIGTMAERFNDGFIRTIAAHLVSNDYRKASDLAREIFEEIEAHFDRRIAFYQDMRFRAYSVGKDEEVKYANTMITNLTIYKEEIAELEKKYKEEGK